MFSDYFSQICVFRRYFEFSQSKRSVICYLFFVSFLFCVPQILLHKTMEILPTTRGQTKLVLEGFIYVKQKTMVDGETIVYECEQRRKGLCKARIKVKDGAIVEQQYEHTHAGDHARVEALKVRIALKRSALGTEQSAAEIIAENISSISDATVSKLPKLATISRTIRKQRQAYGIFPKPSSKAPKNWADYDSSNIKIVADSLENLVIPKEFQETLHGDNFLLYDNHRQNPRILIFGTKESLNLLEQSDLWFCDGTFKVLPELSCHLFCVHSVNNSNLVIPCLYGLLPNQDERTYNDFFREILNIKPNLCPQRILSDFELPSINAIRSTWPNVTIDGCFYHLSQAIYRKIQSEGLAGLYASDGDFSIYIKMIAGLAFIPPANAVSAFEDLQEILPSTVEPICNYFEDNYIGTLRGRMGTQYRQTPRFPVGLWNVYNRVETDLVLMNNYIEEWHRGFQAKVGISDIQKFLTVLQKEESVNHEKIQQIFVGTEVAIPKSKCDNTTQILNIVRKYDNSSSLVYLRDIAYYITL